jgi:hypothetical protein
MYGCLTNLPSILGFIELATAISDEILFFSQPLPLLPLFLSFGDSSSLIIFETRGSREIDKS